jgi:hypothetical protein
LEVLCRPFSSSFRWPFRLIGVTNMWLSSIAVGCAKDDITIYNQHICW